MKRVLIIEDDTVIATVYRNKFSRRGFEAEVATDGASALEKINSWKPDVVLLDIMIPKVNGLDILRSLRANEQTRDLPVVVYSNSFSTITADEARRLGVEHLLSKSDTRPKDVLDIVSGLLHLKQEAAAEVVLTAEQADQAICLRAAGELGAEMRQLVKEYFEKNDIAKMVELSRKTHAFGSNAWTAGLQKAAHLCAALEVLLHTLCVYPKYITFSTDKTVLQAVECLQELVRCCDISEAPTDASILVVDDQDVSLHTATMALQKAKLRALCTTDPVEALAVLGNRSFDLVLLDIDMPKLDGFSLCLRMRAMPRHKTTPVVFFSTLSEVGFRIQSATVGGNDFIGKPFLTIELSVKALTWIVKPRNKTEG